ncbi:E1-E2 ATPase family protein [Cryptosporidium felis]|nr:E1-E2 ATPase family protein [Cryptosporidium felis]
MNRIIERLTLIQTYTFFVILFVLLLRIVFGIWKKNISNSVNDNSISFHLIGLRKSIFGECLKVLEVIILALFPLSIHVSIVTITFSRQFIKYLEADFVWNDAVRIYTKSLLIAIFSVIYFHLLKVVYGSFENAYLVPAKLSDCKFVLIYFRGSHRFTTTSFWSELFGTKLLSTLEKFPILELCHIFEKSEPLDIFGVKVQRYFEYKGEKYWWLENKFIWSRELLTRVSQGPSEQNFVLKVENQGIEITGDNNNEKILEFIGTNSLGSSPLTLKYLFFSESTSIINIVRIMVLLDSMFYSFIVWPVCWSLITFYTIFWSILRRRRNSIEAEELLTQHDLDIYKCLSGSYDPNIQSSVPTRTILSRDLFPGTVLLIGKAMRAPADLLLLNGNVVVDESCLTGEATPINKIGGAQEFSGKFSTVGNKSEYSRQIFAGSQILEVSSTNITVAVVTRTGTATLNGSYIIGNPNLHTILETQTRSSPSKASYSTQKQTNLLDLHHISTHRNWNFSPEPFWIFCIFYGLFIAFMDSYILSFEIESVFFIVSTAIYVIPFWSTSSMSLCYNSLIGRLRKYDILTNPTRLKDIQMIDTVCFDKTGTLTADIFSIKEIHIYPNGSSVEYLILVAMAACNNLFFNKIELTPTILNEDKNDPLGSKLEKCLYDYSGFYGFRICAFCSERLFVIPKCNMKVFLEQISKLDSLNELYYKTDYDIKGAENRYSRNSLEYIFAICDVIEVIERYPFDEISRSQSVSVIKFSLESELSPGIFSINFTTLFFIKGAVEKIIELTSNHKSYSEETNFKEWFDILLERQVAGSYVIGYCYKVINRRIESSSNSFPLSKTCPDSPFIPLGLIELHSPIREEARYIINSLYKGDFHCPIITGDHLNSAVAVAKELGIIINLISCYIDTERNLVWDFEASNEKIKFPSNKEYQSIHEIMPLQILEKEFQIAISSDAFKFILHILNLGINKNIESIHLIESEDFIIFSKLMTLIIVFARFTPELKSMVVEILGNLGMTVLMVGNGPNDFIAIQKANSGVLLTDSINSNSSVVPFISQTTPYGLHAIIKILIESRCIIFTFVSVYQHIILLGVFFVSCKTFLLWQSQAMVPAMAWLYIDIFCTFIPLLLLSFSRPTDVQRDSISPETHNNIDNFNKKTSSTEFVESGDYLPSNSTSIQYLITMDQKVQLSQNVTDESIKEYLYTMPMNTGNFIIYYSSLISLLIVLSGFCIMSNRLVHYVLPKYGIEHCYKYNLTIPVHLWYIRQDNIEAASSWCYIAFQLVNQVWPIWIRSSSVVQIKKNAPLLFWNISTNVFILSCIWIGPSKIGCVFRINCDDETSRSLPDNLLNLSTPFYGQYKNNIFPIYWKFELTFWCILFFLINILSSFILKTKFLKRTYKSEK